MTLFCDFSTTEHELAIYVRTQKIRPAIYGRTRKIRPGTRLYTDMLMLSWIIVYSHIRQLALR